MEEQSIGSPGDPETTRALKSLANLSELPDQVIQELSKICVRRRYGAGQTIAEIDGTWEFIGIVGDGILRLQKAMLDGRQHIVGLLVEGDMFGRIFNEALHFSIEAATDAEVFTFRRRQFENMLVRTPELDKLLLQNVLSELDRARDWMIILSYPKIRARLAGFLLLFCTRFQAVDHLITVVDCSIRIHIPLSRPDMAHLLGTRVESISRALHALADDGLIEILRPDLIEVRRLEALFEEAGESEFGRPASLKRLARAVRKSSD